MTKLLLVVCLLVPLIGASEIVTSCSEPEGYSYFAEGKLVTAKDAGWSKDKITGGRYIVTHDGKTYDIIYIDATKRTVSSREDGAQIIDVENRPGTLVLVVVYPGTNIETWTFKLNAKGSGFVMMSQQRFADAAPIQKYALYHARCDIQPSPKVP